jgi:TolB-like protein/tetratricopeptide (TPR) repeat protein
MNQWSRVKDLFHEALEREPAARRAFLEAACDEADVRREVERLLAAHHAAGTFIEQSPVAMGGRVVGHYRIERTVAAGGMGEVYVARDLELGRTVAIKVALGNDVDSHARLKREAQHASQLNHPNICTIHEIGSSDGQPFIAMELVDGERLSDAIPPAGLPIDRVVRYGTQIASALTHAHQHGVIHRDLKSANVMVTSDERIKVLDFGLARRHSAEQLKDFSRSRESLTGHGLMAGTLSCMAPELLRGGTADARSDIWSLGVLLYEMATGSLPFAGATGFELSGAILHEPPAPFPSRVPPAATQTILRCLEKDPAKRYAQADDVRLALESIGQHDRPRASTRARAAVIAAGLLIAVLAAAPFVWRTVSRPSAATAGATTGPNAIAVMNFENVAGAADTAWLSKGVPRMLVTGLAQTSGLHIVSAQHLEEAARKMGGASVDVLNSAEFADIARQSGADAVVSGTIMKAGDGIRVDVQLHDLASGRVLVADSARGADVFAVVDHLTMRIRTAAGFSNADVRRVAEVSSSSLEAYRLYSDGVDACLNMRWGDAIRLLEEAVTIDPAFAEAYVQLAAIRMAHESATTREEYLRKAAQYADRLSTQQRRFLEIQLARGNPIKVEGLLDAFIRDYPHVAEAYSHATSLYNPVLGGFYKLDKLLSIADGGVKTMPASGPARNSYGYALLANGRYADALREFQTYAQLAPREPNPYDSMGEAYLNLGMPDKAADSYARALSIDPTFDSARNGQALALAALGRYDDAFAVDPELALERALLLSRVGRYREASRVLAEGEKRENPSLDLGPFEDGTFRLMSAVIALERRDAPRARREAAAAERVFAAQRHQRTPIYLAVTHLVAGVAEIFDGRLSAARARLERQKQLQAPHGDFEAVWMKALEGEIALASGDVALAAGTFEGAVPKQKLFAFDPMGFAVLLNHLPSRDGAARAAKARGDLAYAVAEYRRLLTPGAESKWVSVLEPLYVLELARLLEKAGETRSALGEYRRFLDLWKGADAGLPELIEAKQAVARLR